ncbi:hypothetical protein DRO51_03555 [Candidatus Bathyarchaeota archaeon]|nr:MAG: hypothetical protein DRO51_03555 [Candidatus Bathyarchaeota archaeon]
MVPHILDSLKALYWVLLDLANILGRFVSKSRGDLRLHSFLAYNRIQIIVENLGEALKNAGLVVKDKPSKKRLHKSAGLLAINTLDDVKNLINELKSQCRKRKFDTLKIAPKLEVFNEKLKLVIGFLNLYKQILKNEKAYVNLCFTLQTIIQDLNIILQRHEQFLNEALKLKGTVAT